jgi:hypothetical protein
MCFFKTISLLNTLFFNDEVCDETTFERRENTF